MKIIPKKQILIFLAALVIPVGYFLAWHTFKWRGITWHTKYNVPGFLLVGGSLPWSWPFLNYTRELGSILGHTARNALTTISVCFGFAINMTITISLISKFISLTRRST
jgi:hypothetical protein